MKKNNIILIAIIGVLVLTVGIICFPKKEKVVEKTPQIEEENENPNKGYGGDTSDSFNPFIGCIDEVREKFKEKYPLDYNFDYNETGTITFTLSELVNQGLDLSKVNSEKITCNFAESNVTVTKKEDGYELSILPVCVENE